MKSSLFKKYCHTKYQVIKNNCKGTFLRKRSCTVQLNGSLYIVLYFEVSTETGQNKVCLIPFFLVTCDVNVNLNIGIQSIEL